MITQDNFRKVLSKLGFVEIDKNVLIKSFDNFELKADFTNGTLIYPENAGFKINERQTCNFSHNENFVVFECVCRLFEKGYLPKHIELEPKWKLGHGASGGRADILVRNNDNKTLLIIECKTFGEEFEKEWKNMQENGGAVVFIFSTRRRCSVFGSLYL
ncbi:MAG: type I restriction enzyme HsdR N-terminal domain-containing protein [Treponema sp.]|jgi:hypothetical protein|nr:type I restriction enzyme HsdR N-terminal domain-containing protein [Treponema sp.]